MYAVDVSHIAKSFEKTQAVSDVSFSMERGELFGLLGPNGAGKTTTIRMMLDIFRPDQGTVSILGGPITEAKKERIGYMPEERGLYQEITLEQCLLYLASLKGMTPVEARRRLKEQLERFDLAQHKNKKVKELSKGMQQKAQWISTILHLPELIIVDEPFAALDPINVQLVKDLMRELRTQGTTIVMSTHQMHQVEELCDRIVLIHKGRNLLYGGLDEIRRGYASHAVIVRTTGELPQVPGVVEVIPHNSEIKLVLQEGTTPQDVLHALVMQGAVLERFEVAMPTLDEIFVRAVGEGGA
jgi:ABC-2 type transport system ATP-binding protein